MEPAPALVTSLEAMEASRGSPLTSPALPPLQSTHSHGSGRGTSCNQIQGMPCAGCQDFWLPRQNFLPSFRNPRPPYVSVPARLNRLYTQKAKA